MNKNAPEYDIKWRGSVSQLIDSVQESCENGWEPLGGICVNTAGYEVYYYQAMVRYDVGYTAFITCNGVKFEKKDSYSHNELIEIIRKISNAKN